MMPARPHMTAGTSTPDVCRAIGVERSRVVPGCSAVPVMPSGYARNRQDPSAVQRTVRCTAAPAAANMSTEPDGQVKMPGSGSGSPCCEEDTMNGIFKRALSRSPYILAMSAAAVCLLIASASVAPSAGSQNAGSSDRPVMPQYDRDGALRLPDTYRQWVFVGSSLGLSYTEGAPGAEMFNETLMEPTAYREFVRTGTFREGTMLAL